MIIEAWERVAQRPFWIAEAFAAFGAFHYFGPVGFGIACVIAAAANVLIERSLRERARRRRLREMLDDDRS